jgi:hypothetical protein
MTRNTQPYASRQRAVVGGIAYMAVTRAAQGMKTEMEATARHRGVTKRFNAASKMLAYGTALASGGPLGLATAVSADVIMTVVQDRQRANEAVRYEQDKAFERTLKGAKATFGMGGSAYD